DGRLERDLAPCDLRTNELMRRAPGQRERDGRGQQESVPSHRHLFDDEQTSEHAPNANLASPAPDGAYSPPRSVGKQRAILQGTLGCRASRRCAGRDHPIGRWERGAKPGLGRVGSRSSRGGGDISERLGRPAIVWPAILPLAVGCVTGRAPSPPSVPPPAARSADKVVIEHVLESSVQVVL